MEAFDEDDEELASESGASESSDDDGDYDDADDDDADEEQLMEGETLMELWQQHCSGGREPLPFEHTTAGPASATAT